MKKSKPYSKKVAAENRSVYSADIHVCVCVFVCVMTNL